MAHYEDISRYNPGLLHTVMENPDNTVERRREAAELLVKKGWIFAIRILDELLAEGK